MKSFFSVRTAPPVGVAARVQRQVAPWDRRVRYAAAFGNTLVVIVASQLVIPNDLALLLLTITLAGLPLSLWLRHEDERSGRISQHRFIINSAIFLLTVAVSLWVLASNVPRIFSPEFSQFFLVQSSAAQTISLLMEVFLIFAACRCLAIITDKDAVLCTVPSFSVLLLLIVVHKGPEVVVYFLVWAMLAAVLLALDQRSEVRQNIAGFVPGAVPGQEVRLSARGLGGVMGFSLMCAMVLSYTLSGRDPDERGAAENWVAVLASRLTQIALDLPDVSVNAGPERQIDYTSGPALPTRAELWAVEAREVPSGRPLRPAYWRMFTLTNYDGRAWSQTSGESIAVTSELLGAKQFPAYQGSLSSRGYSAGDRFDRFSMMGLSRPPWSGYDLLRRGPDEARPRNFGANRHRVGQRVRAIVSNTGYLPTLPSVRSLRLVTTQPPTVRARIDNSVDIGVLRPSQTADVFSEVPDEGEYGNRGSGPPEWRDEKPNPQATLTPQEKRLCLQLPPTLPPRVRNWVNGVIETGDDPRRSDYWRAKRLMLEIQANAAYTLRPPAVPEGRDATDYFLFESRRGYCTYFAGAFTAACRVAKIPARIVSGFTNPEWQTSNEAILRESGAHTWTEVWVPNWGWATLDATPPDDRGNNAPDWLTNWQEVLISAQTATFDFVGSNLVPLCLTGAILSAAFLWMAHRRRRAVFQLDMGVPNDAANSPVDVAARRAIFDFYRKFSKALARRFRPVSAWETPREWSLDAQSTLNLRDPTPLRELTELYARAKYSPHPLTQKDVEAARSAWQKLTWDSRPDVQA